MNTTNFTGTVELIDKPQNAGQAGNTPTTELTDSQKLDIIMKTQIEHGILLQSLAKAGGQEKVVEQKNPLEKPASLPEIPPINGVSFSADFRKVNFHGTEFSFDTKEAPVMQYLYRHRFEDVSYETLRTFFHLEPKARIRDAFFKNHPAWGTLIVRGIDARSVTLDLKPRNSSPALPSSKKPRGGRSQSGGKCHAKF